MSDDTGTALATREPHYDGLVMVVEPTEAEKRLRELQDFVRRAMVEGTDYGKIPGTDKDTLLQPGAQKLAEIYGFAVTYEDSRAPIENWNEDAPMFAYFKRAIVTRRQDGLFLGSGVGSCNSREEKYSGRWVFEREVPPHLDRSRLRTREGKSKKDGRPYVMFRIPNPAIFDVVNTIEKMACKRALIHAIIAVTRSAGIFTQDLEDMSAEARGARADIPDAEIVEEAPPSPPRRQAPPPVGAAELADRARHATTLDAAAEIVRAARSMPRVRAVAYKRILELAPSIDQIVATVEEIKNDAAIPADFLSGLLLLAEERRNALAATEQPAA